MDAARIARFEKAVAEERGRKAPPDAFPALSDLPAGRYTDATYLALEREALWRGTWRYAAHIDEFPTQGSYVNLRQTDAPIVLVRGRDDEIRAFYNTCRHRGAPVVRDAAGTTAGNLVCGYHGWTYDLEGHLVGVRDEGDFKGLDPTCRSLTPVRCARYGNWIFVCEHPEEAPLSEFLAPIASCFDHLALESLRLVDRERREVRCNVKVLLENFLEVYHFKFLHRHTTDRFLDAEGTHVSLWERGHSLMLSPNRRADWVDPGTLGMAEMAGASILEHDYNPSYLVYPNLIVPIAATGIPAVTFWPTTDRTTCLEVLWFAPDADSEALDPLWETRIKNFGRIVDEDVSFAEEIQASLESPGFVGVPLSYQERRIYHWHEELDRRIGRERVPETLRVDALLGAWVGRD